MNSGSRTNKNRKKLRGTYMNEKAIAIEYVNTVASIRLPDIFLIRLCILLSTNSTFTFA
jgi:hypothetical protein